MYAMYIYIYIYNLLQLCLLPCSYELSFHTLGVAALEMFQLDTRWSS